MSTGDYINFFFEPESVAVVGASPVKGKPSRIILDNLRRIGFEGAVYPVNPRYASIDGLRCYPSMTDVEEPIDLAVIVLPAPEVPGILRESSDKFKGAIVVSGGFKEIGDDGKRLEEDLRDLVREKGFRLLGPNCLGIYDTLSRMDTFFVPRERMRRPSKGGISVLTQSGSFAVMLMDYLASEGIGVARVVSYGNRADVGESDCLRFLAEDEATKAVILYMESVDRGRDFLEAASLCAARKPLVVLKVGRRKAGVQAVRSHTGAVSGKHEVYQAAFKKVGAVEMEGYEGLRDACKILNAYVPVLGSRILIVTDGGGVGASMADACEDAGMEVKRLSERARYLLRSKLPPFSSLENPIDLTGSATDEDYVAALDLGLKDGYELAIATVIWGAPEITPGLVDEIEKVKEEHRKPIVVCSPGGKFSKDMSLAFERKGIPAFSSPESAVRAASVLVRSKVRDRGPRAPEPVRRPEDLRKRDQARDLAGEIVSRARSMGRRSLLESEAKSLASAWGIEVPRSAFITDPEAFDFDFDAEGLEPPLVLKAVSPDLFHKVDVGGVVTGIRSSAELRSAAGEMRRRLEVRAPHAKIEGFLIEETVSGAEFLVGGVREPKFGPVIVFGLGGFMVELIRDITFRLAPLDEKEALVMMREVKSYPLLRGFRGIEPANLKKLSCIIVTLSDILMEMEMIEEIEINPLMVKGDGIKAADVRVLLRE